MNPALITSARPLTYSAAGSVSSDRQVGEHAGRRVEGADQVLARVDVHRGLAADRRVAPPPSSVVGTRISRTPRSQVAATNPARSVVAPPPTPTMASLRVSRCPASRDHRSAATPHRLGRLAVRHLLAVHRVPGAAEHAAHRAGDLTQPLGWTTTTVRARLPDQRGQLAEHTCADDHLVGRARR